MPDSDAILRRLILAANAYYDKNITRPDGDGSEDRCPDGDDFNELMDLITAAENRLLARDFLNAN